MPLRVFDSKHQTPPSSRTRAAAASALRQPGHIPDAGARGCLRRGGVGCRRAGRLAPVLAFPAIVAVLLALGAVSGTASAYNILALDLGGYWNGLGTQGFGADQGFGTPGEQGSRWYTMVDYRDLATTSLLDYDVFLVQSAFLDDNVTEGATDALAALSAKAPDILDFVAAGRGLVAWTEPFPDGATHRWDWAPIEVTSRGVYHENRVEVVDPSHPVMAHSTDASLSDWHASWHGYFESWDPRLQLLASSGDYGANDPRTHLPLTLAGSYAGAGGRIVFSMQDPDYHAYQGVDGARGLIQDALDWSAASYPVPEPGAGLLLAAGLVAAASWMAGRRRFRS